MNKKTASSPATGWLRRLAAALVLLALACAASLAALLTWDDGVAWIELLRYAPYLAWLVPAGVALLLSLALRGAWWLAGLATLALVLGPVMGLSLGLERTSQQERPELRHLRLMTYNIKSYEADWRGYAPIAAEITRYAPDVVVMQDADALNDPEHPVPAEMEQALKGYQRQGFHQYVVASRLPLRGCEARSEPADPGRLTFVRCVVQVDRSALTLVVTHLTSPRRGLNAVRAERLRNLDDWAVNFGYRWAQARRLAEVVAPLPRPLVVAGDLNAPEASPVIRVLLRTGLRDAWSAAGRGWGYTLGHALKPYISFLRIDHVLVSPDIAVAGAAVGSQAGSEHRPVIADLLVPH